MENDFTDLADEGVGGGGQKGGGGQGGGEGVEESDWTFLR